jgi:hypothetical protein
VHGEALRLLKEHAKIRRLNDERLFVSRKGKRYDYREASRSRALMRKFRASISTI